MKKLSKSTKSGRLIIQIIIYISLLSLIYFSFFNPFGILKFQYTEPKNRVHCQEKSVVEGKNLFSLAKCTKSDSRRRLSFEKLVKINLPLAERIALVRDRIRNSKQTYERIDEWAAAMTMRANLLVVAAALFYIVFIATSKGKKSNIENTEEASKSIALAAGTWFSKLTRVAPQSLLVIAIIVATLESFSYHDKYASAVLALNSTIALHSTLEVQTVLFHLRNPTPNETSDEQWNILDTEVVKWSEEIGEINIQFSKSYGATFSFFKLPSLK